MKHTILAAIHAVDPAAAGLVGTGSVLLASAVGDGGHNDVLIVVGIGAILAGLVEWSLQRRFGQHEKEEIKAYSALQMTFQAQVDNTRNEISKELARQALVFDGMAATFSALTKAHHEMRQELFEMSKRISDVEKKTLPR